MLSTYITHFVNILDVQRIIYEFIHLVLTAKLKADHFVFLVTSLKVYIHVISITRIIIFISWTKYKYCFR